MAGNCKVKVHIEIVRVRRCCDRGSQQGRSWSKPGSVALAAVTALVRKRVQAVVLHRYPVVQLQHFRLTAQVEIFGQTHFILAQTLIFDQC